MSKWMVCCRKVCGMRLDLVKEGEAEGLWGLFTLGGKQQEVVVRTGRWLPRAMGNGFPKVVDVWPVCGYGDRPLHIFRSTCYVINISRKCILSPRWGTWAVPNHRTGCVPQALDFTTFIHGKLFSDALGNFPSSSFTICNGLSLSVRNINCIFKYRNAAHLSLNLWRKRLRWELCFLMILGIMAALAFSAGWSGDSFEQKVTPILVLSAWLRLGLFFTITPPKKFTIWRTSAK